MERDTNGKFALTSVWPNPARRTPLMIGFTLPISAPARLEVLDVSGRRIMAREIGALGPGPHRLAMAATLPPGIYLIRLSQGSNVRVRRAVLLY
jgi:hypothetical protein